MKKYTIKDLGTQSDVNNVQSCFARFPNSIGKIWWHLLKDQFLQHKLGYLLNLFAIIASIPYGFITAHWHPLLILVGLNVLIRGSLVISFYRMSKALVNTDGGVRLDRLGLSLIVQNDKHTYVRTLTQRWEDVKEIRVHKDFIVVDMNDNADNLSMFYLHPVSVNLCLATLCSYWNIAQTGGAIDALPALYSDDEREDIVGYIEQKFGPIAFIDEEDVYDGMRVDIAYILPDENHPYYTLCTIGAGALAAASDEAKARSGEIFDRREYMMYIPESFVIDEDNFSNADKYWPSAILGEIAHSMRDYIYEATDIIKFSEPLDETTEASAAVLDYPLPDMNDYTAVSTPSGITVEFVQVIPCREEELLDDYESRLALIMGIPLTDIAEKGLEQAIDDMGTDSCRQALLGHFGSLIRQ